MAQSWAQRTLLKSSRYLQEGTKMPYHLLWWSAQSNPAANPQPCSVSASATVFMANRLKLESNASPC